MADILDKEKLCDKDNTEEPVIIPRDKWKAKSPNEVEKQNKTLPLKYVVFMHTNTPPCTSVSGCKKAVRQLQTKHMSEGAPDILHNYLISLDGTVYEGSDINLPGITYNGSKKTLQEATNNSVNIAIIDEKIQGVKQANDMIDAVAKLTSKLIREHILLPNVDPIWYNPSEKKRKKKKKTKLNLSQRMEHFKIKNEHEGMEELKAIERYKEEELKNQRLEERTKKGRTFNDLVQRTGGKGPYVFTPDELRGILESKDGRYKPKPDFSNFF